MIVCFKSGTGLSVFCVFQLLLFIAAYAKADVGLPYNYKPPPTNYGVPFASTRIPSGSYIPVTPAPNFQTPIEGSNTFGSNVIVSPASNNGQYEVRKTVVQQRFGGNDNQEIVYENQPAFNPYVYNRQAGYGNVIKTQTHNLKPEVTRHVYFYEGPEETVVHQQRVHVPVVPPKKNYKIIFVKAPSYGAPVVPVVPPQQPNEDKTIVYVLVKKPEAPADITVPLPEPTKPSKPEVYFIKYKTQKEAEDKIAGTLQGASGASIIANAHNQGSFVDAIGRDDVAQKIKTTIVQHVVPSENTQTYSVDGRFGDSSSSSGVITNFPSQTHDHGHTTNVVTEQVVHHTGDHSGQVSIPQRFGESTSTTGVITNYPNVDNTHDHGSTVTVTEQRFGDSSNAGGVITNYPSIDHSHGTGHVSTVQTVETVQTPQQHVVHVHHEQKPSVVVKEEESSVVSQYGPPGASGPY